MNGIEKDVTETTETIEDEEHGASGRPVAKVRPRMKAAVTLTSVSAPPRERQWIDINPETYGYDCYAASKTLIRLLRHDQTIPRQSDGVVKIDDILDEFKKKKIDCALQWSIDVWVSVLARGGGPKKRFQHCLLPNSSKHFMKIRAIQRKFRR